MTSAASTAQSWWVPIVAALVGTLLSGVLAFIVATAKLSHDHEQWRMDAMVRGLGHLTGGTQNRSVGIGVISSLIETGNLPKNARTAIDEVLWTQLIHITSYSDPNRSKTEQENATRLIELVQGSRHKDDPRFALMVGNQLGHDTDGLRKPR